MFMMLIICACRQMFFNDKTKIMQKDLKMCSLFSGIGGLELGLEAAVPGLRTCWQVEQNEFCRRVLAKHWPDAERFEDVRTVRAEDIRGADVICGGFPCQDISVAGKGAGLAGDRSGLWWEMHRLIGLALPRIVVAENVPALTSRGLSEVLFSLAQLGYACEWDIISAAAVGACHRRDRLFIVAYNTDPNSRRREVEREQKHGKQQGQRRGQPYGLGETGRRQGPHDVANPHGDGLHRSSQTASRDRPKPKLRGNKNVTNPHNAVLREQSGGGVGPSRAGSSLAQQFGEAGRIELNPWQTLGGLCPVDDGVPGRVARLRALGNAVVPQVAYRVGLRVNEVLNDDFDGV